MYVFKCCPNLLIAVSAFSIFKVHKTTKMFGLWPAFTQKMPFIFDCAVGAQFCPLSTEKIEVKIRKKTKHK